MARKRNEEVQEDEVQEETTDTSEDLEEVPPRDYPRWKFNHKSDEKLIVNTPAEEEALGSGWFDYPKHSPKAKK